MHTSVQWSSVPGVATLPWRSEAVAVASPGPAGAGEAGHPLGLPLLLELPLQPAGHLPLWAGQRDLQVPERRTCSLITRVYLQNLSILARALSRDSKCFGHSDKTLSCECPILK